MSNEHDYVLIDPGTPEFGLWCPACNLPSAIRVTLTTMDEAGVHPVGAATFCDECGSTDCEEPS